MRPHRQISSPLTGGARKLQVGVDHGGWTTVYQIQKGKLTVLNAIKCKELFNAIDKEREGYFTHAKLARWESEVDPEAHAKPLHVRQDDGVIHQIFIRAPSARDVLTGTAAPGAETSLQRAPSQRSTTSFTSSASPHMRAHLSSSFLGNSTAHTQLHRPPPKVLQRQYSMKRVSDKMRGIVDSGLGRASFASFLVLLFPQYPRPFVSRMAARVKTIEEDRGEKLNADQAQELTDIFELLDEDGSGELNCEELVQLASGINSGIDEHEIRESFALFDLDGDDKIYLDEFQEMFKDIYLRAFWSLTKKDPRAARVSKDAYPESSIVTSTRMSHAHLVNTTLELLEEQEERAGRSLPPAVKPPYCKGFLYLHDSNAPTFKMMHWRTVLFVLNRDKVLSYSKHGKESVCGNVAHLVEYKRQDYQELPATWVGFRLVFDSEFETQTPVLDLAARSEKEALKWLDEIASIIPRFQTARPQKPREYKMALEEPVRAPIDILQRRGLVAKQIDDFAGWQALHSAQIAAGLVAWRPGQTLRILLKINKDDEADTNGAEITLPGVQGLDYLGADEEAEYLRMLANSGLICLGERLAYLSCKVLEQPEHVKLPIDSSSAAAVLQWKTLKLRKGVLLEQAAINHREGSQSADSNDTDDIQKQTTRSKGQDLVVTLHEIVHGEIKGRLTPIGPSTWCKLSVGSTEVKTRIEFAQGQPVWDQTFRFKVPVVPDGYGGISADPDVDLHVVFYEWMPRDHRLDWASENAKSPEQIAHFSMSIHALYMKGTSELKLARGTSFHSDGHSNRHAAPNTPGGHHHSPHHQHRPGTGHSTPLVRGHSSASFQLASATSQAPSEQSIDSQARARRTVRGPRSVSGIYKLQSDLRDPDTGREVEQASVRLSMVFEEVLREEEDAQAMSTAGLHHETSTGGQTETWEDRVRWWMLPGSSRVVQESQDGIGSLQVLVIKGRNLRKADVDGLCDPFVVLKMGQIRAKTAVKKRTLEPFWNEAFLFEYLPEDQFLTLDIYDWDPSGEKQELGSLMIDPSPLEEGESSCKWHNIIDPHYPGAAAGQLLLLLRMSTKALPCDLPSEGFEVQCVHLRSKRQKQQVTATVTQQTEEQEEALNIKLDHASLPDETLLELAARSVPVPFHSTVRRKINRVAYGLQKWNRSRGYLFKLDRNALGTEEACWRRHMFVCEHGVLYYYSDHDSDTRPAPTVDVKMTTLHMQFRTSNGRRRASVASQTNEADHGSHFIRGGSSGSSTFEPANSHGHGSTLAKEKPPEKRTLVPLLDCLDIKLIEKYGPECEESRPPNNLLAHPFSIRIRTKADPNYASGKGKGLEITIVLAMDSAAEREAWLSVIKAASLESKEAQAMEMMGSDATIEWELSGSTPIPVREQGSQDADGDRSRVVGWVDGEDQGSAGEWSRRSSTIVEGEGGGRRWSMSEGRARQLQGKLKVGARLTGAHVRNKAPPEPLNLEPADPIQEMWLTRMDADVKGSTASAFWVRLPKTPGARTREMAKGTRRLSGSKVVHERPQTASGGTGHLTGAAWAAHHRESLLSGRGDGDADSDAESQTQSEVSASSTKPPTPPVRRIPMPPSNLTLQKKWGWDQHDDGKRIERLQSITGGIKGLSPRIIAQVLKPQQPSLDPRVARFVSRSGALTSR